MDPRLAALITTHGLITRSQALDLGLSPGEVRRLLRHHEWLPLRRGIYTTRAHWDSLDEYVGQPRLLAVAAGMAATRGWVLSHDSACHLLGLPVLRAERPLVHLTRPGWTNAWTEYGIRHHLAGFEQHQVVEVDGVRALDLARTAVDMAREHGLKAGVVACDAAMRKGVTTRDLEAAYARMTSWPGIRSARTAVDLADPGAESPLESLARELVIEAGIGIPDTQFPVKTTRGLYWADLQVGNHVVEADGEVKLRALADGGVADDPRRSLHEEKLRERALADRGLVVTRVVWEDIWGRRRAEAIARLRRDHAEAVARFGAGVSPALAQEAVELRRRYGDRRGA